MYLIIAQSAFELDPEIYKKHFAKAIGNEMTEEKVHVVKVMIAKLSSQVPTGYSKSTDKIAEIIKAQGAPEINQFLDEESEDLQGRRYLDPSKFKLRLKDDPDNKEVEKEESKEGGPDKQTEESKTSEATPNSSKKNSASKLEESKGDKSAKISSGEEEEMKEI